MFYSAETRWFFEGAVDTAVERWIFSGGLYTEQGERQDEYILLPGCEVAGAKYREGNFELKVATSAAREFALGDTIAGRRETWVKWSRPYAGITGEVVVMREDERWAFVRKRRVLRLFSLESMAVEEVAYGGPWLSAGCQVERTIVSVILRNAPDGPPLENDWSNAAAWWTLGLEAFGNPAEIESNLDRMLDYFETDAPGAQLPREASMSYPAWLATLANRA